MEIRTERAGFQKMQQELFADVPITTEGTGRPYSAIGEFLIAAINDTQFESPAQKQRMSVGIKLIRGVFHHLAASIPRNPAGENDHSFFVPPDAKKSTAQHVDFISAVLPIHDWIFASGTSPWKFGRELAALFAHQDHQAQAELHRLVTATETGPLTSLYMAYWYARINQRMANACAQAGLARLDDLHLQKDLAEWLDEEGLIGKMLVESARALRELSDEDRQILFQGVNEEEYARFNSLVKNKKLDDVEFARQAATFLWNHCGTKELVRRALESHTENPTPATVMR